PSPRALLTGSALPPIGGRSRDGEGASDRRVTEHPRRWSSPVDRVRHRRKERATCQRTSTTPPDSPQGPDPAPRRPDRFVGTWDVRGRPLDAEEDNVSGRLAFEWLTGGFFLQQRVELNFMGLDIAALEVIGYDPAAGKGPSTVFASMIGVPIPYEYDVQVDRVTIRTELAGG